jgi:hypothetical protein
VAEALKEAQDEAGKLASEIKAKSDELIQLAQV